MDPENGPREWTQRMDPENGPREWTQRMDPEWTQNGPRMDPEWTQNGPKMDPKWTRKMGREVKHVPMNLKSRLVALGNQEKQEMRGDSLTAHAEGIHLVFSFASSRKAKVWCGDLESAYFSGERMSRVLLLGQPRDADSGKSSAGGVRESVLTAVHTLVRVTSEAMTLKINEIRSEGNHVHVRKTAQERLNASEQLQFRERDRITPVPGPL